MFQTRRVRKVNNKPSVLTQIMKMLKIVILLTKRNVILVLNMGIKVMNISLEKMVKLKMTKLLIIFLLNKSQTKIEKSICINNMSVFVVIDAGF